MTILLGSYEVQRDMLCNQTFSLDQVSFAAEEIKDAQQPVCAKDFFFLNFQMGMEMIVKILPH